ncbi:DNA adenine methylase [Lacrimispora sp.]|jgi:DNA adenine methylase|uniref:DNA adenine methylase n=1 Tax=Lacrimispora sp. TaxID=2719234 RepID=UPI0028AC22A5|nr:DNA adenine methylase [Lacrimispora sp.]
MHSSTPLRYPGGKAKLFPYMKKLIEKNFNTPPVYAEPFAGGCGLALKLLQKDVVSKIIINDNDNAIYCFWYSILYQTEDFIDLINRATFSIDEWGRQKSIYLNQQEKSSLEIGFSTFYLNRCNRSGMLMAGPIGGKEQNGEYLMDCRFNKEHLIEIIEWIAQNKKRIKLHHVDATQFINYIDKRYDNLLFYLDPPYVKKGKELYKNHFTDKDHVKLAKNIFRLKNKWFVTYDNNDLIKEIYKDYQKDEFELHYSAAGNKNGKEIAIFKNDLIYKPKVNEYI